MTFVLDIIDLSKTFRGIVALDHVTFSVPSGELLCVIGPNGAGKSTLLKLLAGFLQPSLGRILYNGRDITRIPPHERARLGILTKFQITNVYENLPVRDNLFIAAQRAAYRDGLMFAHAERSVAAHVGRISTTFGLAEYEQYRASQLAHGQRQWLEIAMVVAAQPKVLLLDEPTAGMTVEETKTTASMLKRLAASSGLTMVIVEHDMQFVREIARRVMVMHLGRVIAAGPLAEIERNVQVKEIYLGQA